MITTGATAEAIECDGEREAGADPWIVAFDDDPQHTTRGQQATETTCRASGPGLRPTVTTVQPATSVAARAARAMPGICVVTRPMASPTSPKNVGRAARAAPDDPLVASMRWPTAHRDRPGAVGVTPYQSTLALGLAPMRQATAVF